MSTPGREEPEDPDRRLFADQLKAMREQAGMSRDELGRQIGYTGSTIANIENDVPGADGGPGKAA